MSENAFGQRRSWGLGTVVLWALIATDFVGFALSYSRRFEGTANRLGIADQLFGRVDGFRMDFVLMFCATVAIFFALFLNLASLRTSRTARINLLLCALSVAVFVLYLVKMVHLGVIDLG